MINNPNFNIKDEKIINALNKDFSEYINKQMTNFIKKLQIDNTDILNFEDRYYRKTRKDFSNWQNKEIDCNLSVTINKKGLVYNIYENE